MLISKKAVSRLVTAALMAVVVLLLAGLPASAGGLWCEKDPIVNVAGVNVSIVVAIPAEYQNSVTGPVEVQVATRPGVPRSVEFTDAGFNGKGERVTFVDAPWLDASTITVSVQVPVADGGKKGSTPVRLTLSQANDQSVTVTGTSRMTTGAFHLNTAAATKAGRAAD